MISESGFREVLKANGCQTLDATKSSKTKVLAQIQRFQERIRRQIDDNYVEFLPNHASSELYLEQGEALVREAEHLLQTTCHDANIGLQEANTELQKLVESLNEAYLGLRVSCRILQADNLFQCVDEAIASKELLLVLDLLGKLKTLIFSAGSHTEVDRIFQRSACYDAIKVKYHIQANLLQQNLQQRFEQLVQFTEKPFPQAKCISIQVSKDEQHVQDIVMALFQARYNPLRICDFLLEQCLEPLVLKPVSLNYNTDNADYVQLTLSYANKPLSNNLRPSYTQVFEHIKTVFTCLNNINVSLSAEQHVFSIIGDHIKQRLLKLLVDECLMHNIPQTIDEFQNSHMVEDVLNFEHFLADCFLINPDSEHDRLLTQFTEKFDVYFRNCFSKELLQAANKIMQKDLQDMTLIADKHTSEDVANKPLLFPRCMVSKSTLVSIQQSLA